jgi:hypothetical protein
MYCPRCAAQNVDDAKFCRSCGADVSLVPQALTGTLADKLAPEDGDARRPRRGHREPSIEKGVKSLFLGLAFVLIALSILIFAGGGRNWWFWMLIPAFALIGDGVGALVRVWHDQRKLAPPGYAPSQMPSPTTSAIPSPVRRAGELPQRNTGELIEPPPSVTEATTRHLGIPAEHSRKDG